MTKNELKQLIRECLKEELNVQSLKEDIKHLYYHNDVLALKKGRWLDVKEEDGKLLGKWNFSNKWHEIDDLEERPYHNVSGARPSKTFTFGGWRYWLEDEVEKVWDNEGYRITGDFEIPGMPHVKRHKEDDSLTESSMTPEEKVDAWHNGTRRENYKAAGIPKLNTFRDIAVRKGYDEIVKIIDDELARRGSTTAASTTPTSVPAATTVPVPVEEPTVTEPAPETADAVTEPKHFSDELVAEPVDTGYVTLNDKERDALIGRAITFLGKTAVRVRSHWSSAGGFVGSYKARCFNHNHNEIKADRAIDKVRDLSYSHDKLMVLKSEIAGGSYNVDRYYSVDVKSSTKYYLDKDKINDMMWDLAKYYDSELDWTISILTKTNANRKKFKQFLLDQVSGMPEAQAEELTTYTFDKL